MPMNEKVEVGEIKKFKINVEEIKTKWKLSWWIK